MIYAVIDTNVLVSALITHNPEAATAKVVRLLFDHGQAPGYGVFTTSANADPLENTQKNNLEVRVKARPNGDSQKKQEQNKEQNKDQKQEKKQKQKQENKDIISSMLQMFGVRV
jgi:hypothetical protein